MAACQEMGPRPNDAAARADKQRWAQKASHALAHGLAKCLRDRNVPEVLPARDDTGASSGAERRLAGGIGAKRVDVSWATETAGLILGLSVKTINFRDRRSGNYQKNLTNRRSDLAMEAVTLHRRFPYAVVAGFLFLDHGAETDDTDLRNSTFVNAHQRLRLFHGRRDPAGREEQLEGLYVVLLDSESDPPRVEPYEAGATSPTEWDEIMTYLLELVTERNADFYEFRGGRVEHA